MCGKIKTGTERYAYMLELADYNAPMIPENPVPYIRDFVFLCITQSILHHIKRALGYTL